MTYKNTIEYIENSDYKSYSFYFDPISNKNGTVNFIDHSNNTETTVGISLDDKELTQFFQYSIITDLIDLAVAISACDRLAPQNLRGKQRRLFVSLPVRHPELLNSQLFSEKLENLLEWATGSRWYFDFQKRKVSERYGDNQLAFPINKDYEIALWSGGLDALAGLYTRLKQDTEKSFVLFGTGSNNSTYHRQGRVARKIQSIFPSRTELYRVPIHFSDSSEQRKNKVSRARGVVFMLLGAACAYLRGQRKLNVYENGMGAINLPYRASAIGLDHSRSVHPITLLMVSELVSELIKEDFQIHNPFLFWTKAQMCQELAKNGRTDLPSLTMSCDSPHRQKPVQCGYCSSCLLRRQALAASNIEDQTRYVVLHGEREVKGDTSLPLLNMLAQVRTLEHLLNTSNQTNLQWVALTQKFPILDDIVDRTASIEKLLPTEMQSRLIQLYQTYVAEWNIVKSQMATGLVNKQSGSQVLDKYSLTTQQA
ncbi:MAG: 7-cyano-7-deazaguanine synthase [Microcoleaceae cyanobacterium]